MIAAGFLCYNKIMSKTNKILGIIIGIAIIIIAVIFLFSYTIFLFGPMLESGEYLSVTVIIIALITLMILEIWIIRRSIHYVEGNKLQKDN